MPCLIIAEIGVNHNGSLELAKKLIKVAADAGADVAKFQSFTASKLTTATAIKADYQQRLTGAGESQQAMLSKLELDEAQFRELAQYAAQLGIEFMSSPFDNDALRFLTRELNVKRLKIPSGEITNVSLLVDAARARVPIIVSTGMSTLADVEVALGALAFGYVGVGEPSSAKFREAYFSSPGRAALLEYVTILQCTTEYPAPFEAVHLRAMGTLQRAFGVPVGLSDHTVGAAVAIGAVALGASVIEKHITLDQTMVGPDHAASLSPDELRFMIRSIREIESSLGHEFKIPNSPELRNITVARKSLVAQERIRKGESFSLSNLGVKRPGSGISASEFFDYLGKCAQRDYAADDLIER